MHYFSLAKVLKLKHFCSH